MREWLFWKLLRWYTRTHDADQIECLRDWLQLDIIIARASEEGRVDEHGK